MPMPTPTGPATVVGMVQGQQTFAQNWVQSSVNLLNDYVNQLIGLSTELLEFPQIEPGKLPEFELEAVEPPEFVAPGDRFPEIAPNRPGMLGVSFDMPLAPGAPPVAPDVLFPSAPVLSALPPLPSTPELDDVSIPDAPVYTLPQVPTLAELNLPDAPDIDLSQFLIERPVFDTSKVEDALGFSYIGTVQQVRQMLGEAPEVQGLIEKIEEMLLGATGLHPEAEQAMFDRAVSRDDRSSLQARSETMTEWSSRGFSMPGAQVAAALGQIQTANREARQNHNRDVYIRAHEVAVENVRTAIQQGIAYQGMLFDNYLRFYDAARQIADGVLSVVQLIVNARIEMFKTELLVYQAEIERFKAELQAELSRLEEYRLRLEGERVKAELNRLEVEVYQAQLQGVLAVVEIFKSQVDAANTQVALNTSRIEQYKALLDGNRLRLDMDKLRYDIYETAVGAESTKVGVFEAQTRAFGEVVRAYSAQVQGEAARVGAINEVNRARADVYSSEVNAWATGIRTDIDRLNAVVGAFRGEVDLFNAKVQQNSILASVNLKQIDQIMQQFQVDNSFVLKQADQQIAQLQHASTIGSQGLLGASNVMAQLAASAMSAINASIGLSNTDTYGISHSAVYDGGPA